MIHGKFKIGDFVKVLNGRDLDDYFCGWFKGMEQFVGGIAQVIGITTGTQNGVERNGYKLSFIDNVLQEENAGYTFDGRRLIWECIAKPKPTPPLPLEKPFGIYITTQTPKPKRIIRNGNATVVFWDDGSKTVVKRAEGESDSPYTAFTAALAIKVFGSNSAVNRIVSKTEEQEKRR